MNFSLAFLLVLQQFVLLLLATKEPPTKLQIGVKFKPDTCDFKATRGNKIKVHYTGKLFSTGKVFDTSVKREPFEFTLGVGEVIKGWDQGVEGMCVKEKRKLIIPPDLGYGERGAGKDIPGGSALVFDVELLEVIPAKESPKVTFPEVSDWNDDEL